MNKLYRMTKEELERKKILYKYADTKYNYTNMPIQNTSLWTAPE